MTFDELQLCIAIENAGRCSDTPKSQQERFSLAHRVFHEWLLIHQESFFPFTIDEIVRWDTNVRKKIATRKKVEVAQAHGVRCFFDGRNKGPCDNDVECGHLKPRSKGGDLSVANCVIECHAHNHQRSTMSIEEYLSSNLTTEVSN